MCFCFSLNRGGQISVESHQAGEGWWRGGGVYWRSAGTSAGGWSDRRRGGGRSK